jgi:hypothetical protein
MKWYWTRIFSKFLQFLLLIIILPMLHTHLSLAPEVTNSPNQTEQNHILGLQVEGFISYLAFGCLQHMDFLSLAKKIVAEISTSSYEDKGIINHHNMSG